MSVRDLIRNANDLTHEDMHVPEWDGADGTKCVIRVQAPTASARGRLIALFSEASESGTPDLTMVYPAVLVATCVEPDVLPDGSPNPAAGEACFTPEDAEWLNTKSGAVVERVATKGMVVSGIMQEAVEAGKADTSTTPSTGTTTG